MHAPGHDHEGAGESLLLRAGFAPEIARACVTHAAWSEPRATLEDRCIALADKLWKGKRDEALEGALLGELAARTGRARWDVFDALDAICDDVARRGPERLARSVV
ncbi:Phosphohydrolase [Sandaracinus amylolyticus]|nr:Phosphohydrolase [Sandaracinus amylolyticus]